MAKNALPGIILHPLRGIGGIEVLEELLASLTKNTLFFGKIPGHKAYPSRVSSGILGDRKKRIILKTSSGVTRFFRSPFFSLPPNFFCILFKQLAQMLGSGPQRAPVDFFRGEALYE
jgi:hypothetical protein